MVRIWITLFISRVLVSPVLNLKEWTVLQILRTYSRDILYNRKGGMLKMNESLKKSIQSSTLVSVVAIVAMAICCLSALGYNSKISVAKEKIEVNASYSNLIK